MILFVGTHGVSAGLRRENNGMVSSPPDVKTLVLQKNPVVLDDFIELCRQHLVPQA